MLIQVQVQIPIRKLGMCKVVKYNNILKIIYEITIKYYYKYISNVTRNRIVATLMKNNQSEIYLELIGELINHSLQERYQNYFS